MPRFRSESASARGTVATMAATTVLPSVNGATTGMRPTLVRPTDITGLRGLTVASSSGLAPGSAVDTVIVATATTPVITAATVIVAATAAPTDMDTLAVMQSLAEATTAVAAAVASTAAAWAVAVMLAGAADTVAVVTGNLSTHV